SPFERRYSWHLPGPLDRAAMTTAAAFLEGPHDFAAFQAAGSSTRSTDRRVFRSRFVDGHTGIDGDGCEQALIVYEIAGSGFLRHMVRTMVGTLVEVGGGRRRAEGMREVLASRNRTVAGPTAPAAGLVLVGVEYDGRLLADER